MSSLYYQERECLNNKDFTITITGIMLTPLLLLNSKLLTQRYSEESDPKFLIALQVSHSDQYTPPAAMGFA
jgi:hypothetical protein